MLSIFTQPPEHLNGKRRFVLLYKATVSRIFHWHPLILSLDKCFILINSGRNFISQGFPIKPIGIKIGMFHLPKKRSTCSTSNDGGLNFKGVCGFTVFKVPGSYSSGPVTSSRPAGPQRRSRMHDIENTKWPSKKNGGKVVRNKTPVKPWCDTSSCTMWNDYINI